MALSTSPTAPTLGHDTLAGLGSFTVVDLWKTPHGKSQILCLSLILRRASSLVSLQVCARFSFYYIAWFEFQFYQEHLSCITSVVHDAVGV